MSYIVGSLPPIKCWVKREFLYNFEQGHGELEPAIWVSLKALRGQVFRIESLLPNYGALYDKLPIHAYVWQQDHTGNLPIDILQLWDCMGYRFTIIEKIGRTAILKTIDSLHYGKGIVSNDLNNFWNNGSLLITADEQLGFIKKLYFGQLAFQKKSQDILKKMILKEDNASYQLSYMIGSEKSIDPNFWIVGYVEENKHPYFFVMHLKSTNAQFDNASLVNLLKTILLQQGFLKGVR